MQLQSETSPGLNTVTAYGAGYVQVNAVAYRHAICVSPQGQVQRLPVNSASDISAAMLRQMAGLEDAALDPLAFLDAADAIAAAWTNDAADTAAQIVLIGTGVQQQFLPADLLQTLTLAGVGVETMSTQAAARTYNILMMEGRRVVAALFPL